MWYNVSREWLVWRILAELAYNFIVLRQKSLMFLQVRVCNATVQAASMSSLPGTFLNWKNLRRPSWTSVFSAVVQGRRFTRLDGGEGSLVRDAAATPGSCPINVEARKGH